MNCLYVDYNATTPICTAASEAINISLKEDWGNPSSDNALGQKAKKKIAYAKEQVAQLVGGHKDDITFASGGTEVNNMVIFGYCLQRNGNRHVITTTVEHDSIEGPLKFLEDKGEIRVTRIELMDGQLLTKDIINAIKDDTILITVMAANNETGVIMPIQEIGMDLSKINEKRQAEGLPRVIFHSDGAQILGKEPFDVKQCKLDCFTIVGHKFYGPRIGALWARLRVPPFLFGGGQENGLRPGTENTPMIVGLGAAAEIAGTDVETQKANMLRLRNELERKLLLSSNFKAHIVCESISRLSNTVNVCFRDCKFSGKEILSRCKRIVASTGAACHQGDTKPSRVLINSGVSHNLAQTAIRLSLGRHMGIEDIDVIVNDLTEAYAMLLNK